MAAPEKISDEEAKRLIACLTRLRDSLRMFANFRERYPEGVDGRTAPRYLHQIRALEQEIDKELAGEYPSAGTSNMELAS
jgi:hypothetical protein